jgi:hypothetical protein
LSCHQFPLMFETCPQRCFVDGSETGLCVDHEVNGRKGTLMHAEGFPDEALHSIALYSVADVASRDREPKACIGQIVEHHEDSEVFVAEASDRGLINPIELALVMQSNGRAERLGPRWLRG